MNPTATIALWAGLFLITHVGISSAAVRPRLVNAMGAQAYRGVYSLVSFATFVPLILAFAYHKHAGVMLWNIRNIAVARWTVWVAMLIVFVFFAAGLMTPSPAGFGAEMSGTQKQSAAKGILKVSRHPAFVAFSLFGFAHMLMNGFAGDLIFFGSFPAVAIFGGIHQDIRKRTEIGDPYRAIEASTSFFPGAALVDGRQHWTASDMPWKAIVVGVVLWLVVVMLHPMLFGGSPLG
ncbi:MAG TPA: NnrU family protein [Candidatus Binataceae bacterium]|nr:NnrU family protein [Candidatus Binataceae bacterium]